MNNLFELHDVDNIIKYNINSQLDSTFGLCLAPASGPDPGEVVRISGLDLVGNIWRVKIKDT